MKTRVFKGSPFAQFRFGANTIRHYGRKGWVLMAVIFVLAWFMLSSFYELLAKINHRPLTSDLWGAVLFQLILALWAFFVAVSMVPKVIAIFRRHRMKYHAGE